MGLGPHSEGRRGLARGASQALEECELPERMKEGRNGVRSRAAAQPGQSCRGRKPGGGAPMLQRPERSWGQRESYRVSDSAGWGAPPGREAGNREATLLAEWWGRREAPDGLGAPPAGCGGSRSQSGARAQTSGRQRTPASGPQGLRGERESPGRGRDEGRLRPAGLRATWAEAPPLPRRRQAAGGVWLSSRRARTPQRVF